MTHPLDPYGDTFAVLRHALRHSTLPAAEWPAVESAWVEVCHINGEPHYPIHTNESEPDDHEIGS